MLSLLNHLTELNYQLNASNLLFELFSVYIYSKVIIICLIEAENIR